jgi:hypothetical protein
MDLTGLEEDSPSRYIKGRTFFDQLSDYQLLKNSDPWRHNNTTKHK